VDKRRYSRLGHVVEVIRRSNADADWGNSVCSACAASLDSVDFAALALRTAAKTLELLGASHEAAAHAEDMQFSLGEGPCLSAFDSGRPVLVADLRTAAERWPIFGREGHRVGVLAIFAFPLRVGAIRFGTLGLYRSSPGDLPTRANTDATSLAELISYTLIGHADAESMRSVTYRDVNLATGLLAAQLSIGLDDALARLRAYAFAEGRPLLDIAKDVLDRRIRLDGAAE
jgi:GAF domain-containing protein